MKKILFHQCCGPCGTASFEQLEKDGYEITSLYYNPNIHPRAEYLKRRTEAERLCQEKGIALLVPPYNPKEYDEAVLGKEADPQKRCRSCWQLRMREAARFAAENGFAEFGTTLRISPYQDQAELLRLGEEIGDEFGLKFYDFDLVTLYPESVRLSKEREMYRQKYCGCKYSQQYR